MFTTYAKYTTVLRIKERFRLTTVTVTRDVCAGMRRKRALVGAEPAVHTRMFVRIWAWPSARANFDERAIMLKHAAADADLRERRRFAASLCFNVRKKQQM